MVAGEGPVEEPVGAFFATWAVFRDLGRFSRPGPFFATWAVFRDLGRDSRIPERVGNGGQRSFARDRIRSDRGPCDRREIASVRRIQPTGPVPTGHAAWAG